MRPNRALRWALATLPLLTLAIVAYTFSEWLFIVTKPSPTSALPFSKQVAVLMKSPVPLLLPAVFAQAIFSLISGLLLFPRFRWVAILPAAAVAGCLVLLLADNFTYTVFGFGILNAPALVRPLYGGLLTGLMVLCGRRILARMDLIWARPYSMALAGGLTAAILAAPLTAAHSVAPDLTRPPADQAGTTDRSYPNVLLVGIDGVDAPLLSVYGYHRPTTPFLERLRGETLFFENAFSNVGRTHGSLVSLLTGRLPLTTHVTFPPTILQGEDSRRNLPALLKNVGFATMQLGMRHYADAEDANLLGFDAANYRWLDGDDAESVGQAAADETGLFQKTVAERLGERAGQLFGINPGVNGFAQVQGTEPSPYWSDDRRVDTLARYFRTAHRPWFVHVHMLDTHCCAYHPANPVPGWSPKESAIREADEKIRRLDDALRASGDLEETLLVIYSDHTSEWTTTGRVPLMIRFPGGRDAGVVADNVQLADVAPTLLDRLGMEVPDWMDGISLLERERVRQRRAVFGVSDMAQRRQITNWFTSLMAAGPPNYGATSVTMVSGHRWFEMSLHDGLVRSGNVEGHTKPDLPTLSNEKASALILAALSHAGFRVDGSPSEN